jgi:hypothetical protein
MGRGRFRTLHRKFRRLGPLVGGMVSIILSVPSPYLPLRTFFVTLSSFLCMITNECVPVLCTVDQERKGRIEQSLRDLQTDFHVAKEEHERLKKQMEDIAKEDEEFLAKIVRYPPIAMRNRLADLIFCVVGDVGRYSAEEEAYHRN